MISCTIKPPAVLREFCCVFKNSLFFLLLLCYSKEAFPQLKKSLSTNEKINLIGSSLTYAGYSYHISHRFFKDYPAGAFHTKNDLHTWQGMDKTLHSLASYQLNALFYSINTLSGMDTALSLNIAFMESLLFGVTKELVDGKIDIAGWSWYDMAANLSGNIAFYSQEKLFNRQIFQLKYLYRNSKLQHFNPTVLGDSYKNYWLRDYNGQSFWITSSLGSLNLSQHHLFKAIGLGLGYGAHNLLHETDNSKILLAPPLPYKQYYLGLNLQWSQIKTEKRWLKSVFFVLDRLMMPLPVLEFSAQNQFKFHPFGAK